MGTRRTSQSRLANGAIPPTLRRHTEMPRDQDSLECCGLFLGSGTVANRRNKDVIARSGEQTHF